ncbi:MAG: ABC transporter ATP-binding protein [Candidatus Micrarchaeota archaeon]
MKLSNASKIYHLDGIDVHALKSVQLEVRRGEFVGVTGKSGSGKSTLLQLMGCLDRPTSGLVELNGVDVSTISDDQLASLRGKRIGFVFQAFNLNATMTVWDNVALPMRIHEYPESEVSAKVEKLVEVVGLADRKNHYPNQLSGGQQQRVAIARALSTDPDLLLADEPSGNLDSASSKAVMDLLASINEKNGVTIVMVTHEPTVLSYARRIIRIEDGVV